MMMVLITSITFVLSSYPLVSFPFLQSSVHPCYKLFISLKNNNGRKRTSVILILPFRFEVTYSLTGKLCYALYFLIPIKRMSASPKIGTQASTEHWMNRGQASYKISWCFDINHFWLKSLWHYLYWSISETLLVIFNHHNYYYCWTKPPL